MWPRIRAGVNGVFRKMNDQIAEKESAESEEKFKEDFQFFDQDKLDQLKERQIDTVRYLDGVFEQALRHGAEEHPHHRDRRPWRAVR